MIPGLGDAVILMAIVTLHWRMQGLTPVVISLDWERGNSFDPKLNKVLDLIDQFVKEGHKVSLVGASAGSCAVINAFVDRKENINKVISISGRLRTGSSEDLISFQDEKTKSPAFADAVAHTMKIENKISSADRNRILTTRSSFIDSLVPFSTSTIENVQNIDIPAHGHLFSIFIALTFWSKPLIDFLKK